MSFAVESVGSASSVPTVPDDDLETLVRKAEGRFRSIPVMTRAQLHVVLVVPSPVTGQVILRMLQQGLIKSAVKRLGDVGRKSRLYYLASEEQYLERYLND